MDQKPYWELFCATGDPVAYMLYRSAEEPAEEPPQQEETR